MEKCAAEWERGNRGERNRRRGAEDVSRSVAGTRRAAVGKWVLKAPRSWGGGAGGFFVVPADATGSQSGRNTTPLEQEPEQAQGL